LWLEIGYLVDEALYKECYVLVLELESHSTSTAIAWCSQNGSRLRRLQSPLEFRLRLQEVVELIRSNKRLEAIQYAQTHLTPLAMQQENPELKQAAIQDVQAAMTTLAFESPETCGIASYAKLFATDRWTDLVDLFRKTFFEVYGMHSPPSLSIALHAGLSSLNTRACHRARDAHLKKKLVRRRSELDAASDECDAKSEDDKSESAKKAKLGGEPAGSPTAKVYMVDCPAEQVRVSSPVPVCPACSDVGSQLCRGLPFAYHPHSRLVCRVTQSVMDENNPPVVLPNGRVYSRQGIDVLAQRSQDGTIQCVETQEVFAPADAKPVYIL
jgi:macrophage erythroblast attacher